MNYGDLITQINPSLISLYLMLNRLEECFRSCGENVVPQRKKRQMWTCLLTRKTHKLIINAEPNKSLEAYTCNIDKFCLKEYGRKDFLKIYFSKIFF